MTREYYADLEANSYVDGPARLDLWGNLYDLSTPGFRNSETSVRLNANTDMYLTEFDTYTQIIQLQTASINIYLPENVVEGLGFKIVSQPQSSQFSIQVNTYSGSTVATLSTALGSSAEFHYLNNSWRFYTL